MQRSWQSLPVAVLTASLLSACSDSRVDPVDPPPPPSRLILARVSGGQVADLVVSGQLAYAATGRVIATWDLRDPSAPEQVSAVIEPAGGLITGLAVHGNHLYASWRTGNDGSGLTIYSLVDPARPEIVNEIRIQAEFSHVGAIAAANDHLFLFDSENGIWVGSLADPESPVFDTDGTGIGGAFDRTFTDGEIIHVFGKSFIGSSILASYDVSVPSAPRELQAFSADGIEIFDLRFDVPWAIGFGTKLSVLDISDPEAAVIRGTADTLAMTGVVNGTHAYGLGFDGLDVWDIQDPDAPSLVAHLDIDTFAATATATVGGGALMLTSTDRLVYLSTSNPAAPVVSGETVTPGSIDAYDAAAAGETVLFLQQNYGLAIADASTLEVVARHEFDLPATPQERVFNDMHVEGQTAYLAAWGFGLVIVDIADPRAPAEIGRLPAPFAHTVAVDGARAYIAKNTNGPEFGIVDVLDRGSPGLMASYGLPYTPAQVAARDGIAYIAGYSHQDGDPVGLRVIDVNDPSNAAEIGSYVEDCPAAFEIKLVGELAYLACSNGLHVVDVSDPTSPIRVGRGEVDDLLDVRTSLEVRGDRAWFGNPAGLVEFDVTNPTSPVELAVTGTGFHGPINLRAVDDERLLGMYGVAGVHVWEGS